MTKENYQKLNYYLNGCFKQLEKNDMFLINNIYPIARLSYDYVQLTKKYQLNDEIKKNNLTFNDVYLLAREIIENIDKNYLIYYDKLIDSGGLDFSFECSYSNSHFVHNLEKKLRLININRTFSYIDVVVLIHEFMHYINSLDDELSINCYLLNEAISIYFEEYARRYLLDKGIDKEQLLFNERILYTKKTASKFNWYSLILLAYEKFGEIDENTYKLLNNFFCYVSKEEFEEKCDKVVTILESKKKTIEFEYKMVNGTTSSIQEEKLFEKLTELINVDYRYILGTIIAYCALEYSTVEKMKHLCNHINKDKYANDSIIKVLKSINIDIEKISVDIIEDVLQKNETKRKN